MHPYRQVPATNLLSTEIYKGTPTNAVEVKDTSSSSLQGESYPLNPLGSSAGLFLPPDLIATP